LFNTLDAAPEKIQYSINRYVNETRHLYSVMDSQLAKSTSGFLVGDRVTIADCALNGWILDRGIYFLFLFSSS
jgi:glutathione S-transferase